jgi:hypothetical protein
MGMLDDLRRWLIPRDHEEVYQPTPRRRPRTAPSPVSPSPALVVLQRRSEPQRIHFVNEGEAAPVPAVPCGRVSPYRSLPPSPSDSSSRRRPVPLPRSAAPDSGSPRASSIRLVQPTSEFPGHPTGTPKRGDSIGGLFSMSLKPMTTKVHPSVPLESALPYNDCGDPTTEDT